jgi:ABC-type nickel/cobalt efflux system permease component RcnA
VSTAQAHDIPNQRIDRSIQVTVKPGLLEIDYEVSLSELTLTQDLRALIGGLPGAERAEWLARYGQVTGPLNAKGVTVSVDGVPIALSVRGFDLSVEEHPRYDFHFSAPISRDGRLAIHDTNYVSSDGTSRLAVRGRDGVVVSGDNLPTDVEQIEMRPVWLMSDIEERRTRQVEVQFRNATLPSRGRAEPARALGGGHDSTLSAIEPRAAAESARNMGLTQFSRLLDESTKVSWPILFVLAIGLGAAHAIQPGHGKTLVTAAALGPRARIYQPALLGILTATAHMGTVLAIAILLWYSGTTRIATLHVALTRIAGFMIAAAGFWRVGRQLAGLAEHEPGDLPADYFSNRSLVSLGLAGGLVPCWDAVGLVVVAAAIGRLATGVLLVLAFSAGMATVLAAVGCLAWKIKSAAVGLRENPKWQRRLGLAGGTMLSAIGLVVFLQY